MAKTNQKTISEIEQLAESITENSKSTLRNILSEAVSNYLREEVLKEDEDEEEDIETEENLNNETSDAEESDETSNVDDTVDEAPEAEETIDSEGDEWSDFEDYKIGNDEGSEEYDFTNETDTDKLVKVFKLMKNDDEVSVVQDGDTVKIKDNSNDTEYVIELDSDIEELDDELTVESLGYTDNYQDKDPIAGLKMGNDNKNTRDWHKGVPTGTNKPWAGKGNSKPYEEKVFEITLNDEVELDSAEDDVIDENVTTSKYQQRRMVKTMAPENSYVQDGAHEVSQGGKLKESLQKKIDKAILENKQLKQTIAKVSQIMKEAVQVNVNLGHIVRLMVENSTTKEEKEDIIKRFNNAKTNEEAKNLYESISSELKKSHSTIMTEQATSVEGSKKINESKIYEETNSVLDMMRRMNLIQK
jgi:hypothetical protein